MAPPPSGPKIKKIIPKQKPVKAIAADNPGPELIDDFGADHGVDYKEYTEDHITSNETAVLYANKKIIDPKLLAGQLHYDGMKDLFTTFDGSKSFTMEELVNLPIWQTSKTKKTLLTAANPEGYNQYKENPYPAVDDWAPAQGHNSTATHTFAGSFHVSPAGVTHYIKTAKDDEHLRVDHVAQQLAHLAGVPTAHSFLVTRGGKLHLASQVMEGSTHATTAAERGALALHDQVRKSFAAHAWLANYDAAGKEHSNIVNTPHGPKFLDFGGSLHRRAQGGVKDFHPSLPPELESMRTHPSNPSTELFKHVTHADIKHGVERISHISDATIHHVVTSNGLPASIADTLIARKNAMVKEYSAPPHEHTPYGVHVHLNSTKSELPPEAATGLSVHHVMHATNNVAPHWHDAAGKATLHSLSGISQEEAAQAHEHHGLPAHVHGEHAEKAETKTPGIPMHQQFIAHDGIEEHYHPGTYSPQPNMYLGIGSSGKVVAEHVHAELLPLHTQFQAHNGLESHHHYGTKNLAITHQGVSPGEHPHGPVVAESSAPQSGHAQPLEHFNPHAHPITAIGKFTYEGAHNFDHVMGVNHPPSHTNSSAYHDQMSNEWFKAAGTSAKYAADSYSGSSLGFNKHFREGGTLANAPQKAKDLINGINKGPGLPHQLLLYRGIGGDYGGQLKAEAKLGHTIVDKGFMGTSLDSSTPISFAHGGVLWVINTPKGYPVGYGTYGNEKEVLLKPHTQVMIDKIEQHGGQFKPKGFAGTVLYGTVLPHTEAQFLAAPAAEQALYKMPNWKTFPKCPLCHTQKLDIPKHVYQHHMEKKKEVDQIKADAAITKYLNNRGDTPHSHEISYYGTNKNPDGTLNYQSYGNKTISIEHYHDSGLNGQVWVPHGVKTEHSISEYALNHKHNEFHQHEHEHTPHLHNPTKKGTSPTKMRIQDPMSKQALGWVPTTHKHLPNGKIEKI